MGRYQSLEDKIRCPVCLPPLCKEVLKRELAAFLATVAPSWKFEARASERNCAQMAHKLLVTEHDDLTLLEAFPRIGVHSLTKAGTKLHAIVVLKQDIPTWAYHFMHRVVPLLEVGTSLLLGSVRQDLLALRALHLHLFSRVRILDKRSRSSRRSKKMQNLHDILFNISFRAANNLRTASLRLVYVLNCEFAGCATSAAGHQIELNATSLQKSCK